MKLQCAKHGTELGRYPRCPDCYEDNVKRLNEHWKGKAVTLSIPDLNGEKVLADGVLREFYHKTEYVEWSVPAEMADEINKFIEAKLTAYEAKCQCVQCVQDRANA